MSKRFPALLSLALISLPILWCTGCKEMTKPHINSAKTEIKIATFNVSMEATNYTSDIENNLNTNALVEELASGDNLQIKNIAEIIQRTQPDIVLLNEFDYIADPKLGVQAFIEKYLSVSQQGMQPITYPYFYLAPVNTGVKVPEADKTERLTHFGFGRYPGQYAMAVLSKYPIENDKIRTFQKFLWKDMPNHLMPKDESGNDWYPEQAQKVMRLSSKSHWDLPVNVCGATLHVLASHPTPPVFDGVEDRNGRRNHDEIRFWKDYIEADNNSYHYDDEGIRGGIETNAKFVILGDLNASSVEGDAYPGAMDNLLQHDLINKYDAPVSAGGRENKPESQYAATHTAGWGMRADYVLPSSNIEVVESGVFWPSDNDELSRLVKDRAASSDHRLVWTTIKLDDSNCD